MMECRNDLPGKFVMDVLGRYYNVQWMPGDNRYHIWTDDQSYQDALAHNDYGRWHPERVLQRIQDGDWKIVSIQGDYTDEEDISIGSLEEIL